MNTRNNNIKGIHIALAGLTVAVVILAVLLWNERRTERVEFSLGGQTIEVESEG